MMIRVVYTDGQQQLVRPRKLDKLIATGAIERFERSDGWAILGSSPLRVLGGLPYDGPERRAPH